MMEICSICGKSVAPGNGQFVNRVPDFDTVEERKNAGRPHPEGDYICPECDEKQEEEEGLEDKVCDVCGKQVQNEDYETEDLLIEYIVEGQKPRPEERGLRLG